MKIPSNCSAKRLSARSRAALRPHQISLIVDSERTATTGSFDLRSSDLLAAGFSAQGSQPEPAQRQRQPLRHRDRPTNTPHNFANPRCRRCYSTVRCPRIGRALGLGTTAATHPVRSELASLNHPARRTSCPFDREATEIPPHPRLPRPTTLTGSTSPGEPVRRPASHLVQSSSHGRNKQVGTLLLRLPRPVNQPVQDLQGGQAGTMPSRALR